MSGRHAQPLPFGAELLDATRTRFTLWAPDCHEVAVDIEGRAVALARDAQGVFSATAACGAGTRYCYRVAPGLTVPDPASRAQDGDIHGRSIVVDPRAYEWRCADWRGRPWHEAVCYELHVGAAGGYARARRLLPRLAGVGITVVELMPVAEFSGSRNWGYDGVLPFAPEAAYGTPDDLKALVDAAHGLGLCMMLDVVYNHFGPDGNYIGRYASPFFRKDRGTPWGAAIDFRERHVREFYIANALYWLHEYRFDGLRFDAVHAIAEGDFLRELARRIRASVPPDRHVHLVLENEHNDATLLTAGYDAQWNDDAHNALHVLLTGEHEGYYAAFADAPARHLARCMAEGFAYQGEPWPPAPGQNGALRGSRSAHLPPTSFVLFLQNHDQVGNRALGERLVRLCGLEALRAAVLLQLLAPQIPLLFMGEDWGSPEPFLFFTGFAEPRLAEAVRTGRRQEFARFAAFADPARRERIPDPNDPATFAASTPRFDGPHDEAWVTYYRGLLAARARAITPRLPRTRSIGAASLGERGVVARWRLDASTELAIAAQFGHGAVSFTPLAGRLLAESRAGAGAECLAGRLHGPGAAAVLAEPA